MKRFEADQRQTGPCKKIDHTSGTRARAGKVVGLDQHQRLLKHGPGREGRSGIEDPALGIRGISQEFQAGRCFGCICWGNHTGLEIDGLAVLFDEISEGVAKGLPAATHGGIIADDRGHLGNRILSTEHKREGL